MMLDRIVALADKYFTPNQDHCFNCDFMELDVEKLIMLVEERSAIYNSKIPDYHKREITDGLWKEIAAEMNATVAECKTKWHNLRTFYVKVLKDLDKIPPGSKALKRKKKWFYFDAMSFLYDYVYPYKQKNSNNECIVTCTEEILNDESQSFDDNENAHKQFKETNNNISTNLIYEHRSDFTKCGTTSFEIEDPDLIFFKSLLPDLHELTPRRKRQFKEKVLSALHGLLDEQECNLTKST